MRRRAWIVSDAIVSPLGSSTMENYMSILRGDTGIKSIREGMFGTSSCVGAFMTIPKPGNANEPTRFEKICIEAAKVAVQGLALSTERTLLILSTTKGNVELIEENPTHPRVALHESATFIAKELGLKNNIVVSNACISGVLALIVGKRFLSTNQYDHVLIIGADVLNKFVISGFQSLKALSDNPCRPFDAQRNGISLGEGAGAIVLSAKPNDDADECIELTGFGLTNDANHISGPSRTGLELSQAIRQALKMSTLEPSEIKAVSAHGTATLYNDEMEALAFAHAGVDGSSVNSLKGNYGHTLGAAGVIETIISKAALLDNKLLPTKGFEKLGVSKPLPLLQHAQAFEYSKVLKTASGFGGCNAAIILEKRKRGE